jgi:hypothetical protein
LSEVRDPADVAMVKYLVQTRPAAGNAVLAAAAERACAAAEELAREGTPVRYLRSLVVPEFDLCLHLFEAGAPEWVAEATRRAALQVDRIVEAA